jgi:transcriptional regulator with GAF, ATPase, and Fis domain
MASEEVEQLGDADGTPAPGDDHALALHLETGASDGHDSLAEDFSEFARSVENQTDPHTTLVEIVRAAVDLIPGCDEGSVSIVLGRRRVMSEAASGPLPAAVDRLQEELREGPCIDAAYLQTTVRVADMSMETRWPRFSPLALAVGAAGMLSFQLYVEGDNLGALNLFSRVAGAFDDESEYIGRLFASHAAVAYAAARTEATLTHTIETRELIGQAQGILMERQKITSDRAFAVLIHVSQQKNMKLRDVAEQLVQSGALRDGAWVD